MRVTILFLLCASVQCYDDFWHPFDTFVNDMSKKTEQVKQFMEDQENKFLEGVTNNTKDVENFIFAQQDKVRKNLNTYEEGIKKTNDKFVTYLKGTNEKWDEEFKRYINHRLQSKNLLSIIPQLAGHSEMMDIPEAELSTTGIIASHGYSCETHTIITDDGYILNLHRIPRGLNQPLQKVSSKAVLLHHGLFASSADWVFGGPDRSLGFLLADAGYDVWLANVRGNRYSREHATLKTDSIQYWNFSWKEVAEYDLPAVIDYIDNVKGNTTKINYIGHSMGTTILFTLLATKPQYNERLNAGFALAPVVYLSGVSASLRSIAMYISQLGYAATLIGAAKEFMPREPGHGFLGSDACNTEKLDITTCEDFIFMLCGFDEEQLDRSMLISFLSHIGSGTSMKTVMHFTQEISAGGRFQKFDYGLVDNLRVYGTGTPPEYSVENITVPIALFSSKNDQLSSEVDVIKLYNDLKCTKDHYSVPFDKFNHLDFLWAKDISDLLHKKLFEILKKWNL